MKILNLEQKQYLFAAAASTTAKKTTKSTTAKKTRSKTVKKTTKEPNPSGMLMAVGMSDESEKKPRARKTKEVKSAAESKYTKKDLFFKELNKYGLISLSMGAVINHTVNTSYKFAAALNGENDKFKHYEDRSRNYIKPHFSLPSQGHQTRITFGTPGYYD